MDVWVTRTGLSFLGTSVPDVLFMGYFHCNVKVSLRDADHSSHVTMLIIPTGITAHWIDPDFRLQQELLAFSSLEGSHTGLALAQIVYDILDDYSIKEKLYCITTDNAANNYTKARELNKLLMRDGI